MKPVLPTTSWSRAVTVDGRTTLIDTARRVWRVINGRKRRKRFDRNTVCTFIRLNTVLSACGVRVHTTAVRPCAPVDYGRWAVQNTRNRAFNDGNFSITSRPIETVNDKLRCRSGAGRLSMNNMRPISNINHVCLPFAAGRRRRRRRWKICRYRYRVGNIRYCR